MIRLALVLVGVVFCSTSVLAPAAAQSYQNEPWYRDPIIKRTNLSDRCKDMAVSPTGNQIAWVNVGGLSVHRIEDDGRIGDLVKRIDIPNAQRVEFVPSGKQIIVADAIGGVHLIRRSDWRIRVVDVPGALGPTEIEVISQRPEAYISYQHDPHLAVIDFRDAVLAHTVSSGSVQEFVQLDVVVTPAGDFVLTIGTDYTPQAGAATRFLGFGLPLLGLQHSLLQYDALKTWAACVGPDPDSTLLIMEGENPLSVMTTRTGSFRGWLNFDFDHPWDVANSRDGRFIAVAEINGRCLTVISGADVRGVLDPDFDMPLDQVRTHKVDLGDLGGSVVLNPAMDVAYVRSYHGDKIWAVRIGLPDV